MVRRAIDRPVRLRYAAMFARPAAAAYCRSRRRCASTDTELVPGRAVRDPGTTVALPLHRRPTPLVGSVDGEDGSDKQPRAPKSPCPAAIGSPLCLCETDIESSTVHPEVP